MQTVAFIGTGIMGTAMAGHLLDAGYALRVYNRTIQKTRPLVERGAILCNAPGECAQNADIVITIVGCPQDVEEVYFAPGGILESAKYGAYVIDMTTSRPGLSARIYEEAKMHGIRAIDAPVSGGDIGAQNATLTIMVGGDADAVTHCMPLFQCMGKNIVHIGGPGAGMHCKMANQIALAGALAGVSEALSYMRSVGVSPETVLSCISQGAAGSWQMTSNMPKMIAGDYAPGFYIKHFCKDMHIAREEAAARELALPVLNTVLSMYETLVAHNMEDLGTQALIRYFD